MCHMILLPAGALPLSLCHNLVDPNDLTLNWNNVDCKECLDEDQ